MQIGWWFWQRPRAHPLLAPGALPNSPIRLGADLRPAVRAAEQQLVQSTVALESRLARVQRWCRLLAALKEVNHHRVHGGRQQVEERRRCRRFTKGLLRGTAKRRDGALEVGRLEREREEAREGRLPDRAADGVDGEGVLCEQVKRNPHVAQAASAAVVPLQL